MAEVYTVAIDNSTPVEITGGRVGNFRVVVENNTTSLYIGGPSLAVAYPGGVTTVTDGLNSYASPNAPLDLYVTSPDEVYAVLGNYFSGTPLNDTLTIFHNR